MTPHQDTHEKVSRNPTAVYKPYVFWPSYRVGQKNLRQRTSQVCGNLEVSWRLHKKPHGIINLSGLLAFWLWHTELLHKIHTFSHCQACWQPWRKYRWLGGSTEQWVLWQWTENLEADNISRMKTKTHIEFIACVLNHMKLTTHVQFWLVLFRTGNKNAPQPQKGRFWTVLFSFHSTKWVHGLHLGTEGCSRNFFLGKNLHRQNRSQHIQKGNVEKSAVYIFTFCG